MSRDLDLIEPEAKTKETGEISEQHICAESLQLEVKLQRANKIIEKLQRILVYA